MSSSKHTMRLGMISNHFMPQATSILTVPQVGDETFKYPEVVDYKPDSKVGNFILRDS